MLKISQDRSTVPAHAAAIVVALVMFGIVGGLLFGPFAGQAWRVTWDAPMTADVNFLHMLLSDVTRETHLDRHSDGYASIGGYAQFVIDWLNALFNSLVAADVEVDLSIRIAAIFLATGVVWRDAFHFIYNKTLPVLDVEHRSGAMPLYGKLGIAHADDELRDWRAASGDGVRLHPDLVLPLQAETENIVIEGRPGSGKSVIAEGLAAAAVARRDRVLAIDVKGGLRQRVLTWRAGVQPIELGLGGDIEYTWDIGADTAADGLIGELVAHFIQDSRDPMWADGTRQIFAGLIRSLHAKYGVAWGWRSLDKLFGQTVGELEALLRPVAAKAAQLLHPSGDGQPNNTTLSLVITMIASAGALVETLALIERRARYRVSLSSWAAGDLGARPVILRHDLSRKSQSNAVLGAIVQVLSGILLSPVVPDGVDHRIWIFLDELSRLKVDVEDLVALGRSRGERVVATVQSRSQISKNIGPDSAKALFANFHYRIICGAAPGSEAIGMSDEIGMRWVRERVQPGETPPQPYEIRVLEPSTISGRLGTRYTWTGRRVIRAAILGFEHIPILDWPVPWKP